MPLFHIVFFITHCIAVLSDARSQMLPVWRHMVLPVRRWAGRLSAGLTRRWAGRLTAGLTRRGSSSLAAGRYLAVMTPAGVVSAAATVPPMSLGQQAVDAAAVTPARRRPVGGRRRPADCRQCEAARAPSLWPCASERWRAVTGVGVTPVAADRPRAAAAAVQ